MDSIREETECSSLAPPFPLARFCYFGSVRGYYPFGNTPAEDSLENCADTSQPSVLALGCGDLRSCFYTFWKHFDSSLSTASTKFDGVCFTLNDCSAAILARNILFLYLCLQLPDGRADKKKWLCAMWALWFCHELYPDHVAILDSSLKELITFSKSAKRWRRVDNPLHPLVHFPSSACLSEVACVWAMWLNRRVDTSLMKMHQSRNQLLSRSINSMSEHSFNLSKGHTFIHGEKSDVRQGKAIARAPEVQSYLKAGSCYAEHVLGLKLLSNSTVNLTMYERQQYSCHYGLVPFECFYHTVEFSPQYVKSKGVAMPYDVVVPSESFKSKPFLANSFQQFAMWIQSSSKVLKDAKFNISFNFDCQDAITFCQQKAQQSRQCYDVITTSNLMDHISPANLVLACVPLLKVDGLLTTTSMCCKSCANTGEEFMDLCFGFNSQLFPVVLGVRCISHEGSGCSNPVMINPSLPDISHTLMCLPHVRNFVWVKISNAQKLIFSRLPCVDDGNITEALVNLIGSCTYALLSYGPGQGGESNGVLSRNGIETALGMLDRFISLSGESTTEYSYWEPLCAALKHVVNPFLHCLQTQILLHGIHAHLTISKEECPLCHEEPLASTLGCFCAGVGSEWLESGTPYFVAFVHQCTSQDSDILQQKALEGEDVHVFDCFGAIFSTDTLRLKFFAPLTFMKKGYQVTIAMVHRTNRLNWLITVFSAKLKDIQMPWTQYAFCQIEKPSQPIDTNLFGTVTSHVCDGQKFETEISLSEEALKALPTARLNTERVSSSVIRLCCRSLSFLLDLAYPIDYSTLKMSESKGSLSVCGQRQLYSLGEERPCFTVNPDHCLSIVPTSSSMQLLTSHFVMQLTNKEVHVVDRLHPIELPSLLKVKLFLQVLFECAMSSSFFLISILNNNPCLIVVNAILFDYQHKVPALDLAFCFVDDYDHKVIMKKWESLSHSSSHSSKVRLLPLEETGLSILKEVLAYFSQRTHGTVNSAGSASKYAALQEFNINHAFTRCVLYLLLCDPDVRLYASGDFFGLTTARFLPTVGGVCCAFCRRLSFTAKKCGRCEEVNYCSKHCQTKHWKAHKKRCKPATKHSTHHQCTFCEKRLENSGKNINCTCAGIQYCSTECQSKHWPEHRKTCEAENSQDIAKSGCSFCKQSHSCMKKCTRCGQAQYCNRDCQREHWSKHKEMCIAKHWPEHEKTCAKLQPHDTDKHTDPLPECSCCKKASDNLKNCTRCGIARYCDRDCQTRHWPEHKSVCRSTDTVELQSRDTDKHADPLPKCSHCKKASDNLKNCTRCEIAQYCNRECQTRHWAKHKKVCTNTTEAKPGPSTSSQKCSYCRKASFDLKNCAKCKAVQYCSQDCLQKHLPEHEELCKYIAEVNEMRQPECAFCGSVFNTLFTCKKCGKVKYCGRECQSKHWKMHKVTCANY
jgi:hypothetical protein